MFVVVSVLVYSVRAVLQARDAPRADGARNAVRCAAGGGGRCLSDARCEALAERIGRAGRYLAQGLRLMVGVPDYGDYVAAHGGAAPRHAGHVVRGVLSRAAAGALWGRARRAVLLATC